MLEIGWLFRPEWEVVLASCSTSVKRNSLQATGVAFNWMNQAAKMTEQSMVFSMFLRQMKQHLKRKKKKIFMEKKTFSILGTSIVRQIMVFLFLWPRYHCPRYRVNHVCHVPVPRNRSIRSAPWAVLLQRTHHAYEWAHRYRSQPPHIMLSTAHTKRAKKLFRK